MVEINTSQCSDGHQWIWSSSEELPEGTPCLCGKELWEKGLKPCCKKTLEDLIEEIEGMEWKDYAKDNKWQNGVVDGRNGVLNHLLTKLKNKIDEN